MVFLLAAVALSAVGIVLARRGWRGQRVGDEPFCPTCDYNLTGAPTSRCPECGHDMAGTGPRFGHVRKRRGLLAVAGLAMLGAIALAPGAYFETRHDLFVKYYANWPTGMLLSDLDSYRRVRATEVLSQRYREKALTASQVERFAEQLLAIVTAPPPRMQPPGGAMEALAYMLHEGDLTQSQAGEFLSTAAIPKAELDAASAYLNIFRQRHLPKRPPFLNIVGVYRAASLEIDGEPRESPAVRLTTLPAGHLRRIKLTQAPRSSARLRLEIDWYVCGDANIYDHTAELSRPEALPAAIEQVERCRRVGRTIDEVSVSIDPGERRP